MDLCIGPYKILRQIAEDGRGRLFHAIDPERRKYVVIRSLRPEAASRPEVVARLYSEAETLARLNHPHIARIFGFVRMEGRLHLVMEYVEGESLATILEEKHRLEPKIAIAFFQQILSAVRYAHDLGVVHGNLKPSNIIVSSFAQLKILNFATAAILGNLDRDGRADHDCQYHSPEQLRREPIDARSDIYSLGVLLYRLLAGELPVDMPHGASAVSAASPSRPSLPLANCPDWFDSFMRRALAADPSERFQSIAAMSAAIGSSEGKPTGARVRRQRLECGVASVVSGDAGGRVYRAPKPMRPDTARPVGSSRAEPTTRLRWKRYALLAILVVSLLVVAFFFDGKNTVPTRDAKPTASHDIENSEIALGRPVPPSPSLMPITENDAGNIRPRALDEPDAKPARVKRASPPVPAEKPRGKPAGRVDDLHLEALNTRRTVTYRADVDTSRAVLQDVKTTEPNAPRRNSDNSTVKPQLNVKWEN